RNIFPLIVDASDSDTAPHLTHIGPSASPLAAPTPDGSPPTSPSYTPPTSAGMVTHMPDPCRVVGKDLFLLAFYGRVLKPSPNTASATVMLEGILLKV
ncbi:hypothetical protein GWI33_001558, partial [Rhynchophorus ferrugineus]